MYGKTSESKAIAQSFEWFLPSRLNFHCLLSDSTSSNAVDTKCSHDRGMRYIYRTLILDTMVTCMIYVMTSIAYVCFFVLSFFILDCFDDGSYDQDHLSHSVI